MDDQALFKSYQQKPLVAVPTVILAFACVGVFYANIVLGIQGTIPLWFGCLVNCIAGYLLFSPIHDSLHRSVSSNHKFNEFIALLTVNGLTPYASVKLFRFMHMQHHRFTNEEDKDPDAFAGKGGWRIWSLWFFWDALYLVKYWQIRHERPQDEVKSVIIGLSIGLPITVALFYAFPLQIFFLWFIPNRMTVWLICYIFMYLPHQPHSVEQKDAPFHATLIRTGWDKLLDPVLMYQNYHLVHHLYPTIPFYLYKKAWFALEEYHTSQQPATVSAFQLKPDPDLLQQGINHYLSEKIEPIDEQLAEQKLVAGL